MEQPINGKLLVRVVEQYKHLKLESENAYKLAGSTGVVLSVAPDLESLVRGVFHIKKDDEWPKGLPKGEEWVGKTIRWEKYADQNSKHEIDDPNNKGQKISVTLIDYKDITSYEQ